MKRIRKSVGLIINLVIVFLLVGCQQKESILPPKDNNEVAFKTKNLIAYNEGSTTYSLGQLDSKYIFSHNRLIVKSQEDEQTYDVTYNLQDIDKQAFEELLQTLKWSSKIDISKYKTFVQYNLCMGTADKPGYRLYVVDDEYWVGVLYGDRLWRCIALELEK